MRETPSISGSTYASQAVNMAAMGQGLAAVGQWLGHEPEQEQFSADKIEAVRRFMATTAVHKPTQETTPMATRRLVQVFIADPNENVPLEQSMLYTGEQKFTDSTDQELFFEIDIKSILDAHNKTRVMIVDKKVKERTEYLEPIKIRDLKMVVVTVAQF